VARIISRAEAVAFRDARFFQVNQACFATGDHQAVVGDKIAHRAQTVAIEFDAD